MANLQVGADAPGLVVPGRECDSKRFATLRAQLALKAYSLVQLQAGSYLVGRWGSSRELADLSAVEQFLQRVSP